MISAARLIHISSEGVLKGKSLTDPTTISEVWLCPQIVWHAVLNYRHSSEAKKGKISGTRNKKSKEELKQEINYPMSPAPFCHKKEQYYYHQRWNIKRRVGIWLKNGTSKLSALGESPAIPVPAHTSLTINTCLLTLTCQQYNLHLRLADYTHSEDIQTITSDTSDQPGQASFKQRLEHTRRNLTESAYERMWWVQNKAVRVRMRRASKPSLPFQERCWRINRRDVIQLIFNGFVQLVEACV